MLKKIKSLFFILFSLSFLSHSIFAMEDGNTKKVSTEEVSTDEQLREYRKKHAEKEPNKIWFSHDEEKNYKEINEIGPSKPKVNDHSVEIDLTIKRAKEKRKTGNEYLLSEDEINDLIDEYEEEEEEENATLSKDSCPTAPKHEPLPSGNNDNNNLNIDSNYISLLKLIPDFMGNQKYIKNNFRENKDEITKQLLANAAQFEQEKLIIGAKNKLMWTTPYWISLSRQGIEQGIVRSISVVGELGAVTIWKNIVEPVAALTVRSAYESFTKTGRKNKLNRSLAQNNQETSEFSQALMNTQESLKTLEMLEQASKNNLKTLNTQLDSIIDKAEKTAIKTAIDKEKLILFRLKQTKQKRLKFLEAGKELICNFMDQETKILNERFQVQDKSSKSNWSKWLHVITSPSPFEATQKQLNKQLSSKPKNITSIDKYIEITPEHDLPPTKQKPKEDSIIEEKKEEIEQNTTDDELALPEINFDEKDDDFISSPLSAEQDNNNEDEK